MTSATLSPTALDAQRRIKNKIEQDVMLYCEAIGENYKQYYIRMLERNLADEKYDYPSYAQEQLDAINNGTAKLMKFIVNEGRKYFKIIQCEFDTFQDRNEWREGSVHSFVNKNTGEVYKPASWSAPHTKHVRYDLRLIKDREFLHNAKNVGWAGGYLYLK